PSGEGLAPHCTQSWSVSTPHIGLHWKPPTRGETTSISFSARSGTCGASFVIRRSMRVHCSLAIAGFCVIVRSAHPIARSTPRLQNSETFGLVGSFGMYDAQVSISPMKDAGDG